MKKKWIPVLLLSIAVAGLAAFFATVKLIESSIANADVLGQEARNIEEKAGLSLKYANARYEPFRGLVVDGVHLFDTTQTNDGFEYSSGQAVFQFRRLDLLRGQIKPSRLVLQGGRFKSSTKGDPRKQIDRLVAFLKGAGLDLEWRDIQVDGMRESTDISAKDVRLTGTLIVPDKDAPSLRLALQFKGDDVLELKGSWKPDAAPQQRLFLRIDEMPVRLPYLWMTKFAYLPFDANVEWKEGLLQGEGSIDFTNEGYAVHLRGAFEQMRFLVAGAGLEANGLDGSFEQMIIGSYATGLLHSQLSVHNPIIEHSAELDKDLKTGIDETRFKGRLRLSEGKNLKLPPYLKSADVDYAINIKTKNLRDRQAFSPDVNITLRNVRIDFGDSWKSLAPIHIDEGTIVGSDRIAITLPGTLGTVPFRFTSSMQPDLFRPTDAELVFRHQSDFQLDIDEMGIDDTVNRVGVFIDDLRGYVNGPDAVRSEDFGPVWENKFFQNPHYRKFIEQAVVNGQIRVLKIVDAAPDMPSSLQLQFRHRVPSTELTLTSSSGPTLNAHYRIFYDQALPSHDGLFELKYSGTNYRSRLFTDPQLKVDPLESLEFKYTFQAEGLYLADLYYKSLTALFIKAKHVPVQKDYRLDLLLRLMELEQKPLRYVDFDIQRHSAGSLFKPLLIRIESDEGSVIGNGEFNIYEGGMLQFNYYLKPSGRQSRFNIRIRPDQVWIPSS